MDDWSGSASPNNSVNNPSKLLLIKHPILGTFPTSPTFPNIPKTMGSIKKFNK